MVKKKGSSRVLTPVMSLVALVAASDAAGAKQSICEKT
jgi:hypothetical protein